MRAVHFALLGVFAQAGALAQNSAEATVDRTGKYDYVREFAAPSALAFENGGGYLFAASAESDEVVAWSLGGIEMTRFGASSSAPSRLLDPRGLAVDNGEVFVADAGHQRIAVFTTSGAFLRAFGAYGGNAGAVRDPHGVAATKDALYVCDTGNDRVQKFTRDGVPLAQVGAHGFAHGEFIRPLGVAVDDAGFVYVTDSGNHRVQKFDAELRFVKSWGDFGPHSGFFAFPDGIATCWGHVFVADTDNHRVQVFDADGTPLYEWGVHAQLPREGLGKLHYPSALSVTHDLAGFRAAVAEPSEDRVQFFDAVPAGEELPRNPPGVRVTSAHYGKRFALAGDLMATTEPGAPSLVLYDTEHDQAPWEPIEVTRASLWGRKPGQLLAPNDVALDWERKLLYVADVDALRLSCFRVAHDETTKLGMDFFLLKFVRSLDFGELHRLGADGAPFAVRPDAIELDPWGGVAVLDALQRRLFHVAQDFAVTSIEMAPLGSRPIDFVFASNGKRAFVVDELDGEVRLLAVSDAGAPKLDVELLRIGTHGSGAGQFVRASGITVAADGSVYVSDSALNRVQHFAADGRFLAAFGADGVGPVEFHKPAGLALDRSGRLWVDDWGNHRGQVLTPSGEFVVAFGSRWFVLPTLNLPGAQRK